MSECKENFGEQYLQRAELHNPWYLSFRMLHIREKELAKNKNRVALVRCAEAEKIVLYPNETRDIVCHTDKELEYAHSYAIIHETENSSLPSDIDITPSLITYKSEKGVQLMVNLSNLTTRTVVISPKALICELQPVVIEGKLNDLIKNDEVRKAMDQIHIDRGNNLSPDEREQIDKLLNKHSDIFSVSNTDIGCYNRIKHRVDLLPEHETPFKIPHRRIPPGMVEEVRTHLQQLLDAGIIKKSCSPWSRSVVLVRKKNGKLRMCVDYRMLNQRSVKDAYALPRIEEIFDCLAGSKYFSTIDMKAGYHQVEVEEVHRERTACSVGNLGFYEYVRMPFGLSNCPATYQRLIEECLGDYNMTICVAYLDDLIIFSSTYEEHLEILDKVLTRLKENNLKLSPEKCFFIEEKLTFLGHVVSAQGIETDPSKIEKIKNWPPPPRMQMN